MRIHGVSADRPLEIMCVCVRVCVCVCVTHQKGRSVFDVVVICEDTLGTTALHNMFQNTC